jgi:hypothetical protein
VGYGTVSIEIDKTPQPLLPPVVPRRALSGLKEIEGIRLVSMGEVRKRDSSEIIVEVMEAFFLRAVPRVQR